MNLEEEVETIEDNLLKLLTGSKFGKLISVNREFTEHNRNSPLARPVVVTAKFFTENGSVITAEVELSSEDLEKLHEGA